jgi:hypothetical protein
VSVAINPCCGSDVVVAGVESWVRLRTVVGCVCWVCVAQEVVLACFGTRAEVGGVERSDGAGRSAVECCKREV